MLRREQGAAGQRVTFVELFFDLVYVLAVTQLSHLLLGSLLLGLAATLVVAAVAASDSLIFREQAPSLR
jgi:low temperature requirement protein LtrA